MLLCVKKKKKQRCIMFDHVRLETSYRQKNKGKRWEKNWLRKCAHPVTNTLLKKLLFEIQHSVLVRDQVGTS